jgi:GntR family transcriptional repressor for pyruvate dehydrogenase complex
VEFAPIKRDSLSEEVAKRLLAAILDGEMPLGERLPAERELVRQFDVGRPTIREALRVLSVLGVIEVRSGEGAFIVRRHADFIANAFRMALLLDPQDASDVIHVRIAIESELAGLAAQIATPAQREDLLAAVDRMAESADDTDRLAELDLAFHLQVARIADNVSLSRLLDATRLLLRDWIARVLSKRGRAESTVAEHRAIALAIHNGDAEAARAAMRAHLVSVGQELEATIK